MVSTKLDVMLLRVIIGDDEERKLLLAMDNDRFIPANICKFFKLENLMNS